MRCERDAVAGERACPGDGVCGCGKGGGDGRGGLGWMREGRGVD